MNSSAIKREPLPIPAALLTPLQAAEWLGVSRSLLSYWRAKGEGPEFVRLGKKVIKYRLDTLQAFVSSQTQKGA